MPNDCSVDVQLQYLAAVYKTTLKLDHTAIIIKDIMTTTLLFHIYINKIHIDHIYALETLVPFCAVMKILSFYRSKYVTLWEREQSLLKSLSKSKLYLFEVLQFCSVIRWKGDRSTLQKENFVSLCSVFT